MSQENQPLSADEANTLIQREVVIPAFMTKLAAYGIEPNSQEELQTLVDIGVTLLQKHPFQQTKAASVNRFANVYQDMLQANQPSLGEQILRWSENLVSTNPVMAKAAAVLVEVDNAMAAAGGVR